MTSSVILVNIIGIAGVAIGTLVANIFRSFQYAIYIDNNLIKRGKGVFLRKLAWSIMNASVIVLSASSIVNRYAYKSWVAWVVCAMAVTVFSIIVTVVSSLIFYRKDMIAVYRIVQRAFIKRKKVSNKR